MDSGDNDSLMTPEALRQVGIDEAPTVEMMETSQKAGHRVCTAFRVSKLGHQGSPLSPFQGVGQGNLGVN